MNARGGLALGGAGGARGRSRAALALLVACFPVVGAGQPELPAASPAATAFAACPEPMLLIQGDYCPRVAQECLAWVEPPTLGGDGRCARFAPSRCVATRLGGPWASALKGGWWLAGRNRCRPATVAHDERYRDFQTGFRCCADARPP
jgi:hypothetical protein